MKVEISNGELLDKLSILEIKKAKIVDPIKLKNIDTELVILANLSINLLSNKEVAKIFDELCRVNLKLWEIEDNLRNKELHHQFDGEFLDFARSVYFTNDERSELKRAINNLTESTIIEEKSYTKYRL